jgi:hypothetical protein
MIHIANEIEQLLMTKRSDTDDVATLAIQEHKFKKISDKLNDSIYTVYIKYKDTGLKMTDIILGLRLHFDIEYLVDKLLNKKIKALIKKEYTESNTIYAKKKNTKQ